jgi:hypothetical protein
MTTPAQPPLPVPTYKAEDLTAIKYWKRSFDMYPVFEHELKTLARGYSSPHLALASLTFGAWLTMIVTTSTVTSLPETFAIRFFVGKLVSGVFTVYFGIMAWREWSEARQFIANLRKETVEAVVTKAPTE